MSERPFKLPNKSFNGLLNSLDTPDAFIIEYFIPVSQTYIIPVKGMNLIKFSLKAVVGLVETETPKLSKKAEK